MRIELARKNVSVRWSESPNLSAIHAAYVVAAGNVCTDGKTQNALVGSATDVNNRLLSAGVDVAAFWESLFAQSLIIDDDKRSINIALVSAGCGEMQLEQIASGISNSLAECRLAYRTRFPKLAEQLKLRIQPLRDQWDSFGDDLLLEVASQIWGDRSPADWWPSRPELIAVQPCCGGDGGFDADASTVWIEATLTDVDPAVPELLRMVWLMTRIATKLHTREKSSTGGSRLPWALGSIPIVLKAGQALELLPQGNLPIQQACRLWRAGDQSLATILERWWREYQESDSALPVALKALDQMLAPQRTNAKTLDLSEYDPE